MPLYSRKSTGLPSRMAAFSKPFASKAVAGATIFKPGVEAYQDSGLTE